MVGSMLNIIFIIFFFNDTATTEIYTLSLHDALPIFMGVGRPEDIVAAVMRGIDLFDCVMPTRRSEEHTSELQSQSNLVCRLLLEKKNKQSPRDSYASQITDIHHRHKRSSSIMKRYEK